MAAKVKVDASPAASAPAGEAPVPEVRTVRVSKCPSVSGQSTITYEFGLDPQGRLMFRVTANSGGGMFSRDGVLMKDVIAVLNDPANADAISARSFSTVFMGKSINTQSFLLAALRHEGVVVVHPDKPRAYQVFDVPGFEARMEALGSASTESVTEGKTAATKPDKRPVLKLAKKSTSAHRE